MQERTPAKSSSLLCFPPIAVPGFVSGHRLSEGIPIKGVSQRSAIRACKRPISLRKPGMQERGDEKHHKGSSCLPPMDAPSSLSGPAIVENSISRDTWQRTAERSDIAACLSDRLTIKENEPLRERSPKERSAFPECSKQPPRRVRRLPSVFRRSSFLVSSAAPASVTSFRSRRTRRRTTVLRPERQDVDRHSDRHGTKGSSSPPRIDSQHRRQRKDGPEEPERCALVSDAHAASLRVASKVASDHAIAE